MTTISVFDLSRFLRTSDGVVVGPAWTDHLSRELLRALRLARPAAPDAYQWAECGDANDFAIAARVFHEVLTLHPSSVSWPLFAGNSSRPSLLKAAVEHCFAVDEAAAICALDETELLLASNVARWLLRLPQQGSPTLVFVPAAVCVRPTRRATAREVAAVA